MTLDRLRKLDESVFLPSEADDSSDADLSSQEVTGFKIGDRVAIDYEFYSVQGIESFEINYFKCFEGSIGTVVDFYLGKRREVIYWSLVVDYDDPFVRESKSIMPPELLRKVDSAVPVTVGALPLAVWQYPPTEDRQMTVAVVTSAVASAPVAPPTSDSASAINVDDRVYVFSRGAEGVVVEIDDDFVRVDGGAWLDWCSVAQVLRK
jgi:hypothetical protein